MFQTFYCEQCKRVICTSEHVYMRYDMSFCSRGCFNIYYYEKLNDG